LAPVCRDCGSSADEVPLSPYLDFQLCSGCIARREREVRAVDERRRQARSAPRKPAAAPKKKGGKKGPGGKTPKRRR
jgi:hypothetical protein